MRIFLIFIFLMVSSQLYIQGQTEIITRKTDTIKTEPIKKLIIIEPIVLNDDRIIRNTIKSAIVEEIDTIINIHFMDNDKIKYFSQDSVYIKLDEIIKSLNPYDAVLIPVYGLLTVIDNSGHYPLSENYSLIGMFLYDRNGNLIRKKIFSSLSADKYGFKINPLKGIKTATMLATYSIIRKINRINKKCYSTVQH